MRMEGYDYTLVGAYFVTTCTQNRICSLGSVNAGIMHLNDAGTIVLDTWKSLPLRFPFVELDAFEVMPNHVHGVLLLNAGGRDHVFASLGHVMRAFKAASTRLIRKAGSEEFAWQRDYYDHIVRNEAELGRIREYIEAHPARWDEDPENPIRGPGGC